MIDINYINTIPIQANILHNSIDYNIISNV